VFRTGRSSARSGSTRGRAHHRDESAQGPSGAGPLLRATDVVAERGDEGVARIQELTGGLGAHSVIEAVGTQQAFMQSVHTTRLGDHMGYVGVNYEVQIPGVEYSSPPGRWRTASIRVPAARGEQIMRTFASSLVFMTALTVGVPAAFAQPEPRAAVSASVGVGQVRRTRALAAPCFSMCINVCQSRGTSVRRPF
jgi:hypothetical protein